MSTASWLLHRDSLRIFCVPFALFIFYEFGRNQVCINVAALGKVFMTLTDGISSLVASSSLGCHYFLFMFVLGHNISPYIPAGAKCGEHIQSCWSFKSLMDLKLHFSNEIFNLCYVGNKPE
jgi:hypothetical protein